MEINENRGRFSMIRFCRKYFAKHEKRCIFVRWNINTYNNAKTVSTKKWNRHISRDVERYQLRYHIQSENGSLRTVPDLLKNCDSRYNYLYS